MRRPSGMLSSAIVIAAAAAVLWACGRQSPTQPTPPVACTFSLSQSALTVGPSGGSASVTVTTRADCAWTAISDRGWMRIDSGASGTGPGAVAVTLTANPNPDARAATLTIADQAVGVTQRGATICTVTVSPASAVFTKDAATGSFTVAAPAGCAWSAATADAWIAVTSGASGAGTAVVGYAITRNTSLTARTGAIRVEGAVFSIEQKGDTPACDFHVSPVAVDACMAVPYELAVSVAAEASCAWTVTSDTPWVTVSGGASRSGPGEIRFRVGDNYDAPRLGVVKVRWDTPTAGQNVQVSQAGCRYAVSASVINVPAAGGSQSVDVYQQSDPLECGGPLQNGCVWAAATDAAWIAISGPMPRKGDDRLSFSVAPNPGAARSATITVRDKTVLVLQAGG